ncbi:hypothetical protein [Roseomonas genomospecies 6]|uniref:Uncharacterized protein n=1 Tax=Roseomonas genomospecies 6 TaxID=214106 RepID=A0A9W7KQJ2_9PROT|nr:hypothetical protein [Roseomonas genomospecies 6]KAA0677780.1 hypothetical protein DS843_21920 [Roseomonas genomospecies 6]
MSFHALPDALFADPNVAEDATFTPADGVPASVRVIRKTASADFRFDGTTVRSDAVTFKLRVADVPTPTEGDTITDADGAGYVVQGAPSRTMRGLVWLVEAVPA